MVPLSWVIQQLPIPIAIETLEAGSSSARSVITTWVTVVGTILALTMAVVVFAAQAFVGSRLGKYGGSLQDFVASTGLVWILNGGVTALFSGGTALLGWGFDAPGGWSGTVSVIWGAGFILAVPMVFWRVVGSVDSRRLREWRLARVRQLVRRTALDNAVFHMGELRIGELCVERGVEQPVVMWSQVPSERVVHSAPIDGQVFDINLEMIDELAGIAARSDARLSLYVHLGDAVRRGEPLVTSDVPIRDVPNIGLVRVKEPVPERAVEFIDALHGEALDAIRSGQPSWYGSIVDTYVEVLLGPPRAARDLDVPPDVGLRSQSGMFTQSLLDRVAHYLYEELVEAVLGRGREVAFEAMYLPKRVAQEAVGLGARELFARIVRLYPEVYLSLVRASDPPLRDVLLDRTWRHLVEVLEYPIGRDLVVVAAADGAAGLEVFASIADECVVDVLRWMISMGDWHQFDLALDEWLESLSTGVAGRFGGAAPLPATADNEGERDDLAIALASLATRRQQWLFGLAMWALRVGKAQESPEALVRFLTLQDRLGTAEDLLGAVSEILGGFRDHAFSHWIMMELPPRRIHVGGADAELLSAFVGSLLVRVSGGELSELPPLDWLPARLDAAQEAVDDLAGRPALVEGLRITDIGPVAEAVHALLNSSAEAQKGLEDERERKMSVPDAAIEAISGFADASWENSRFVSRVFETLGRSQPADVPESLDTRWVRSLVDKIFLQEDRLSELEHFGSDLGRALSRGEMAALLGALAEGPSVAVPTVDLQPRLASEIGRLRGDGFEPTCVLLPVQWRLHKAIGLPWNPSGHPPPPGHLGIRSGSVARHIGSIEGVPAFYSSEVDDGHLYIVDLSAFGRWMFPAEEGCQKVHVEIVGLTDEDPAVAGADEADRNELLKRARVQGLERFAIRVDNPLAGLIVNFEE